MKVLRLKHIRQSLHSVHIAINYIIRHSLHLEVFGQFLIDGQKLSHSIIASAVRALAEVDPGSVTGTALHRSPKVTIGRSTVNTPDTPFIYENFNYAAQNTADYKYLTTTLTTTFGSGYATFNGGSSTAAGETLLQSYRSVPIFTTGVITVAFNISLNIQPVSNFQCEFGLFSQSGAAPYTPTDGVYFRITSAGLIGVSNFNGSETTNRSWVSIFCSDRRCRNAGNGYYDDIHHSNLCKSRRIHSNGLQKYRHCWNIGNNCTQHHIRRILGIILKNSLCPIVKNFFEV